MIAESIRAIFAATTEPCAPCARCLFDAEEIAILRAAEDRTFAAALAARQTRRRRGESGYFIEARHDGIEGWAALAQSSEVMTRRIIAARLGVADPYPSYAAGDPLREWFD